MAASTGVLGDFARMPLSRKILLFVVIGGLGGLLYWQFTYKPLVEKVQAAEGDNRAKAAQNKKLAEDIPKYEELKGRMKELTAVITENQKALPTEAEVRAHCYLCQGPRRASWAASRAKAGGSWSGSPRLRSMISRP